MRLVVGAVLLDDLVRPTRVLSARRSPERNLAPIPGAAGAVPRWEFPGGKVDAGESPQEALHRELAEELGVRVRLGEELAPAGGGCWPINHRLELRLFRAVLLGAVGQGVGAAGLDGLPRDGAGRPVPDPASAPDPSHDAVSWLGAGELVDHPWLPTNVAPARMLVRELSTP